MASYLEMHAIVFGRVQGVGFSWTVQKATFKQRPAEDSLQLARFYLPLWRRIGLGEALKSNWI
jgi:hypothetical protein